MAQLSDSKIKRIKQGAKPQYYGDQHGLRLRVLPSGSKYWVQRLTIRGKRRDLGLGQWPYISLAEARDTAFRNKAEAIRGGDPQIKGVTFAKAAAEVAEVDAADRTEKTIRDHRAVMDRYVLPALGSLLVAEVRAHHIRDALLPIWVEKHVTAKRALQHIGRVLEFAIHMDYRTDQRNPSEFVAKLLPAPRKANGNGNGNGVKHRDAVAYQGVSAALAKVDASGGMEATKGLIRFTVLTAVRISEARLAEWSEFDLDTRTWTIPADRMKSRREHRVPLSPQALAVLERMRKLHPWRCPLVFHSHKGKALGDATVRKLLQRVDVGGVVHGFRSSFRDWCGDTGQDREIAEHCLAHVTGSATERAYARTDLLERRRAVMDAWGLYLEKTSSAGS